MRTIWRVLVRTVFWSFERGTWPYDVAVVLIVAFVLLSPRSWFHDRPPVGPASQAAVEWRSADPAGGIEVYRVDARLLVATSVTPEPELEHQLHEAVQKSVEDLHESKFEIVRIDPVKADDGSIAFYDVSIKP